MVYISQPVIHRSQEEVVLYPQYYIFSKPRTLSLGTNTRLYLYGNKFFVNVYPSPQFARNLIGVD